MSDEKKLHKMISHRAKLLQALRMVDSLLMFDDEKSRIEAREIIRQAQEATEL